MKLNTSLTIFVVSKLPHSSVRRDPFAEVNMIY